MWCSTRWQCVEVSAQRNPVNLRRRSDVDGETWRIAEGGRVVSALLADLWASRRNRMMHQQRHRAPRQTATEHRDAAQSVYPRSSYEPLCQSNSTQQRAHQTSRCLPKLRAKKYQKLPAPILPAFQGLKVRCNTCAFITTSAQVIVLIGRGRRCVMLSGGCGFQQCLYLH